MATAEPQLGSRISVITKARNRYEGVLANVNWDESTITLVNVSSFGTENRSTDHPVLARGDTFPFLVLDARFGNIVLLDVIEEAPIDATTSIQDPAIIFAYKSADRGSSTTPKVIVNVFKKSVSDDDEFTNGEDFNFDAPVSLPSPPIRRRTIYDRFILVTPSFKRVRFEGQLPSTPSTFSVPPLRIDTPDSSPPNKKSCIEKPAQQRDQQFPFLESPLLPPAFKFCDRENNSFNYWDEP